jgi:hypothetical protein
MLTRDDRASERPQHSQHAGRRAQSCWATFYLLSDICASVGNVGRKWHGKTAGANLPLPFKTLAPSLLDSGANWATSDSDNRVDVARQKCVGENHRAAVAPFCGRVGSRPAVPRPPPRAQCRSEDTRHDTQRPSGHEHLRWTSRAISIPAEALGGESRSSTEERTALPGLHYPERVQARLLPAPTPAFRECHRRIRPDRSSDRSSWSRGR